MECQQIKLRLINKTPQEKVADLEKDIKLLEALEAQELQKEISMRHNPVLLI